MNMESQKLIYSRIKCNNYLYFTFYADEFDTKQITIELNIKPTSIKIKKINALKEKHKLETRLQFVIDVDITPEASTPFFGLNKRTINFLNQTKTEVDFDLYKAGVTTSPI